MQNIEDIYPLSPLQQGMLFHTLYAPGSGIYCEQMGMLFRPPFDKGAFKAAWRHVIERHAMLRTAFLWEELDEPVQVVHNQVTLPWVEQDWQEFSHAEQATALETFLRADLRRGFEMAQAPLLRLTLLRLSQDTYHFIWSYHHLLLDGWSIALVLDEVFACYEQLRQGAMPNLPAPRPYRDYVAWLQAQDIQTAEGFWRRYLSDFSRPTPLIRDPFSHSPSSPNREQIDSQECTGYLSQAATSALQNYIRQHQLTLNTVSQGAWALLLSCYSGETDIVFGHTVSTRPADLVGVESMVGLFLNTLPVRVHLPPEEAIVSWLKSLQEEQAEARQYDYAPLAQIQQWGQVPAGQSLFESLLVVENYPRRSSSEYGESPQNLTPSGSWSASERTNYPLTLSVGSRAELLLRISYAPDRFSESIIQAMLERLRILLEHIVANPQMHLKELPYLTAQERHQILMEWNTPATVFPREQCLHTAFEEQVERSPESIALVHENHHITYSALNIRANQVAHTLLKMGIRPEIRVGLCIERSPELFIGLLACLKAGGAYVPLDPAWPQERLRLLFIDAQITVLLTTQATFDSSLSSLAGPLSILYLDSATRPFVSELPSNPPLTALSMNLAYVIYTSGSTGSPKGVLVPHQGVVNYCYDFLRRFGLRSTDRILQFASICFDTAVEEIFPVWYSGGTLVLAPERITAALSFPEFTTFVERYSLTILDFPTTFWQEWIAQGLSMQRRPPCQLRLVIVGAEKVDVDTYHAWHALTDHQSAWANTYGPTEATIVATAYIPPDDPSAITSSCIPIGRPITNTQVYILTPSLQPVAVYGIGELYIGGVGVTRGYLNQPDWTAERFVPHPFSQEDGARLYRTGDRARYLSDGTIEFLDRFDHQVKLRGYRIELGEIEAVLNRQPSVQACVVLAREDQPGDKRLVAYLLPATLSLLQEPGAQQDANKSLLHALKQSLPACMIPTALLWLAQFPRTPGGKLDRSALPRPEQSSTRIEATFIAPRNSIEETVAQIWAEVLGLQRVSIDDNFFESGGHSLRATQVISRVREFFQLEVPVRSIFDGPTVAELAEAILLQGLAETDSDELEAFFAHRHE